MGRITDNVFSGKPGILRMPPVFYAGFLCWGSRFSSLCRFPFFPALLAPAVGGALLVAAGVVAVLARRELEEGSDDDERL